MQLTGLHLLLTYRCNYECDHCFVWSGPSAPGAVLTRPRLDEIFQMADDLGTVRVFYFEGGEAFLYYPLLFYAVARAHALGYRTGIVTNGYWATSTEDALLWLEPLAGAGLDELHVSADGFHGDDEPRALATTAERVASDLGIEEATLTIDPPTLPPQGDERIPGEPVVGGGVMFRGRAAATLTAGLPTQPWQGFDRCPHERLDDPGRVHVDPFGHVQLCQGISMGNVFETPLAELLATYDAARDPVVGPVLRGGPAELARIHGLDLGERFVDACHLCYLARRAIRGSYPETLAPANVYGDPDGPAVGTVA